jgi:hypothetical protein
MPAYSNLYRTSYSADTEKHCAAKTHATLKSKAISALKTSPESLKTTVSPGKVNQTPATSAQSAIQ